MKKTLAFLLCGALLAAGTMAGIVQAQERGGDDDYVTTKSYNFEDDLVEGNLLRPDATIIDTIKKTQKASLIKIRQNFIPEILKSAEDI